MYLLSVVLAIFHAHDLTIDFIDIACAVLGLKFEAVGSVDTEITFARKFLVGHTTESYGDGDSGAGVVGEFPHSAVRAAKHLHFDRHTTLLVIHLTGSVGGSASSFRKCEAEIATHTWHVDTKLRHVAAVNAKSGVGAIKTAVELRDSVGADGRITIGHVVKSRGNTRLGASTH